MKKMFLMGRSEAGKTSLVQALRGEALHYAKTQYTHTDEQVIDSPGEYSETKNCGHALACFSFEADVIAILMAADEPFTLFNPACQSFFNRPLVGIITKINAPHADLPMVRSWLAMTGCERIFEVDSATWEGLDELKAYLAEDIPEQTLREACQKQALGMREWEPLEQTK